MNQYIIRREFTQFLGPLRCQACISRNRDCIVNKYSRACDDCSSETRCLFTRTLEKTGTKGDFSWEELNVEASPQSPSQQFPGTSQLNHNLRNLETSHTRDGPYDPSPMSSSRYHDADLTSPHARNPPDSPWLGQSVESRQRYTSGGLNDNDEPEMRLAAFNIASPYAEDNSSIGRAQLKDHIPRDDRWKARYPPMPSADRLPSIRDSLSSLDPRMTSDRSDTRHVRLPLSFDRIETMLDREEGPNPAETQTVNPSNLMDLHSYDFISETFDTASGSMESRRGKRRGKLSESSAVSASKLRAIGACWKCKLQKNQCSIENPCSPCIKTLKAGRYCPPCFRGQLTDLMPWLFWGKELTPQCTASMKSSGEMAAGAHNFLSEVRKQDDELLNIALRLYESDSSAEMLDLCGIVLRELETSSYRNKNLTLPQFYCICIIDILSRAMEICPSRDLTSPEDESTQGSHSNPSGFIPKRNDALDVLFGLIRLTGPYDPFITISKATGSKPYNRDRHGNHLISYVEACLFKLKPTGPRAPQDIASLRMSDPPISEGRTAMTSRSLPSRSASGTGKKRGLSADGTSRGSRPRAGAKQRTARSRDLNEMEEDSGEEE